VNIFASSFYQTLDVKGDMSVLKKVLCFAIILAVIDMIWLYGGSAFHKEMVMSVQKSPLEFAYSGQYAAAICFYLLAGLSYVYIIEPLAKASHAGTQAGTHAGTQAGTQAVTRSVGVSGAMVGAAMYFTFDLTNKAIFKDYTWKYVAMDGAWGTFAMSAASVIMHMCNL